MIDDKKKGPAWNWTYKKHKILITNDTKYRITHLEASLMQAGYHGPSRNYAKLQR